MPGSMAGAEDIPQEAFLRLRREPEVDIQSLRAFLVTIVSRLCINNLQSARCSARNTPDNGCPNR
jgi:RNA polymerase sigma-70 factor (ECF subfamily)